MHTTPLDERENLFLLSCINAVGKSTLYFHISKGKQIRKNYIHKCETGACMAMQRKAWMGHG